MPTSKRSESFISFLNHRQKLPTEILLGLPILLKKPFDKFSPNDGFYRVHRKSCEQLKFLSSSYIKTLLKFLTLVLKNSGMLMGLDLVRYTNFYQNDNFAVPSKIMISKRFSTTFLKSEVLL